MFKFSEQLIAGLNSMNPNSLAAVVTQAITNDLKFTQLIIDCRNKGQLNPWIAILSLVRDTSRTTTVPTRLSRD